MSFNMWALAKERISQGALGFVIQITQTQVEYL
jgi:hypothetical protein